MGDTPHEHADAASAFLARLANQFSDFLTLSAVATSLLRFLRDDLGFESCAVAMLEQGSVDVLKVVGASGSHADLQGTIERKGRGIVWDVLQSQANAVVPDLTADPRGCARTPQERSGVFVPLVVGGRPIGILGAYRASVGAFTPDEVATLDLVARPIAGTLNAAQVHQRLRDASAHDPVTGLATQANFVSRVEGEIRRAVGTPHLLTVAVLRPIGVPRTVVQLAANAGERGLVAVAHKLRRGCRRHDVAARMSGDEFALLLPETTAAEAEAFLQQFDQIEVFPDDDVFRSVERTPIVPGAPHPRVALSLAWGAATWPVDGQTPQDLMDVATCRLRHKTLR
ncbi:MAG TPA: GAF domain-containing protein [bacterium]|nr:GAF domain-containing protein [bacterium]